MTRFSLDEALEMFPEARDQIPFILNDLKEEEEKLARQLSSLKKLCLDLAEKYWKEQRYADAIRVEGYYYGSPAHERFKKLSFHVKHLEGLLTGNGDFLSQYEIDKANEFPMRSVLGGNRDFYRCPFHNERTASLHITKNKWYCHGCGQGGNTIGFVMKKYDLPFKQAVRAINTYKL